MYRVLRKNLEHGKRFYRMVELSLEIDLSGAEKSALVRHLSQTDHTCWSDLWRDTRHYLWNLGHRSKKFEKLMENERYVEGYWNRVLSDS